MLPIAVGAGRVRLAVVLPIVRVLLSPLACALPARFEVVRIGGDFVPAVTEAALPLAVTRATNGLPRLAFRGAENPLAIWATTLFGHADVVAFGRTLKQKPSESAKRTSDHHNQMRRQFCSD